MWHTVTLMGYRIVAKVFETGSKFGIDGGKVSKLEVYKDGKQLVNYDRGWDFSDLPMNIVHKIVGVLEHIF